MLKFLHVACLLSATTLASQSLAGDGGSLQIYVSKAEQSLTVYDGDQVVATSHVSTGKPGHSTPSGIFSILEKQRYHESNLYSSAPMPWMQRLTWSGVALHESNSVPNYPASHGCVRLPRAFAKALYQMTERGAHVIITDEPVTPAPVRHATLFQPRRAIDEGQLLSDAELRPSTIEAGRRPVQVAMVEKEATSPVQSADVFADIPPVRILITRRGQRETLMDVQAMLTELGFDAGPVDGYLGRQTISAIDGYKRWKGLETRGEILSPEFLTRIYASAGKGAPPLGQIMVRQKFKPVFEAAVSIADPQKPLGTHFIEATHVDMLAGSAEWRGVTLENHLSSQTMKRLGIEAPVAAELTPTLAETLDRISIPDAVRRKIEPMLGEGSSITISDAGVGPETGDGTDFITVTREVPRG
ncbi:MULTISPECIES: L,D-transpeptidase family protein [Ciceribacter]|uniref:L,D-transpeptidase-like protein n=1 Tax=Ciceribacter lividus TaxID=1197950 RepID=A0A6I7HPW7_9HYPH|nr:MULTISPECIES: L,D-transpeptidase family protein [Ciceribacter]MCO6177906.1 L,D-transpeptidase family protein [Ciceribacter sp. RN22]RCW27838.1 L,D-transpeptidase-like protein [Ciceribacter lividus]